MHIETLKIFCDLIETKSFSKTAKLNYLSQSAVSQQIKQLEERFEKRLVERGVRTLQPTEGGKIFYKGCRDILDRYYQLERSLTEDTNVIGGTVKISVIYSIGLHEMPYFIKEFLRKYPNVNVHIEYARAPRIYDDVCANMSDIGIVAIPGKDRRLVETNALFSDQMVLITHPEHALASKKKVKLEDLKGVPFVAFEHSIPTRKYIDKQLRKHSVKPDIAMEFDNVETIKGAVEIDAGVAIVPLPSVQREISNGTLKAIKFTDANMKRPICMIYRKDKIFSTAGRKFIDELEEMVNNLGPELVKMGFATKGECCQEDLPD